MAQVPYPITGEETPDLKRQVWELIRELYEDRVGGLYVGDVFADSGDVLSLQVATAGGLEKSSNYLQIKNQSTGGLQSASTGEAIKCKALGGLNTDSSGLYIETAVTQGLKTGLIVTVRDSGGVYISTGMMQICGANYSSTTTIFKATTNLSADTLYYIYVNAPTTGTTLTSTQVSISTTVAVWNDTYGAYYKSGDATKRLLAKYIIIT